MCFFNPLKITIKQQKLWHVIFTKEKRKKKPIKDWVGGGGGGS